MRKILFFMSIMLLFFGISCSKKSNNSDYLINILYTTDVHCGIDNNLGYSALYNYKTELEKNEKYVSLIDSGDSIQGGFMGSVSKGDYIIDIMNEMGYESMTLGNHEFDYGMDNLKALEEKANFDFLSCNIEYTGKYENKLANVKPYKILKYGKAKIGILGVSTPESLTSSLPSSFKEDGEYAYGFTSDTTEEFFECVQNNIDELKDKGCDHVVISAHLGYEEKYRPYSSLDLANNISGALCILDGHAHISLNTEVKDKDNKDIPILDCGYQLDKFGHIKINKDGLVSHDLIENSDRSEKFDLYINGINDKVAVKKNEVIAYNDIDLKITDDSGIRLVRDRETVIGNLCADAVRYGMNADIGIINGGSIRANLSKGNITYGDVLNVNPYGNKMCKIKATGKSIKDYLEYATRNVLKEYKKEENGEFHAIGEDGAFPNVSGLKYEVDTSINSSCTLDLKGNFQSIDGEYRVKNIKVLINNEYQDLDLDKEYTIGISSYYPVEHGDGVTVFNEEDILEMNKLDYEILIDYLKEIDGNIGSLYNHLEGRITIL